MARTAVFTKGTRIKATNNSTTFYGTVESSSYSTNTTVTLIPNTDYSLANSPITSPYYSYQASPVGYPGEFNYSPTWGGFSSAPSTNAYFSVVGVTVNVHVQATFYGTSNSTSTTVTLPAPAAKDGMFGFIQATDNSNTVATPGRAVMTAQSSTMDLYTSLTNGGWTASSGKSAAFMGSYDM